MRFGEDAFEAVHRATDGVLYNQLCDHALILAYAGDRVQLDAAGIEEAWSDLQQLPAPWTEEVGPRRFSIVGESTGVVEFGGLDDDSVETLATDTVRKPHSAQQVDPLESLAEKQFDKLHGHVDELEEEFQPAGTIRPEVEFVIPELTRTATTSFDEEEIVIDRYAELEAAGWLRRPQVASREGSELAALLKKFLESRSADALRVSEPATHNESASTVSIENSPPEPAHTTSSAGAAPIPLTEPEASNELDLIVIEDNVDEVRAVTLNSCPLARRQEYRQLFAKVRSG